MSRLVASLLILLCANDLVAPASAWQITIDTVPVGNAGNANNPADGDAATDGIQNFGAVDHDYRIGKYEVTNAQYAAFLNLKAKSDPLGLYNTNMGNWTSTLGTVGSNITRSGADGSFTYVTNPSRDQKPVDWVSWYSAIRFANWLNNGQGDGDTETGAYALGPLGAGGVPLDGASIARNPSATWFLPSEDEWYKAAYHQNDGVTSHYFIYPTSSNAEPTAEAPPGGSNSANYSFLVGDLTNVGSYTGTMSPYGAFDMGGNVWEWNEALRSAGSTRGLRGGAVDNFSDTLHHALYRWQNYPTAEFFMGGFRVATIPEPSTLALAGMGLAAVLGSRVARRRRGFARASTVGLVALVACLGLPFGEGQVANAQFAELTDRVEIYDASTGLWKTDKLSQARANPVATSAGGKALFAGGGASLPFVSDRVDLFEASTGQWSTASLSQPRIAMAATSVGDLALFAGGYDAQGQGSSRVDLYDAKNDQWSQSALSVPRNFAAATTIGNRALFGGGSADAGHNSASDVVDIYDAATGDWSSAHLSQARDMLAATAVGGKAFFAGGYDSQGAGYSDVVDIYDASTDQWSVAHLSEPRALLVAATVGNKAVFAGGDNAPSTASAVVDIYDTDTGQWSVANLTQARWFLAAAAIDNKAYFAGGTSGSTAESPSYHIVDVYDGTTGLWSLDHLPVDHAILGGTAVGDLALFGGGYSYGVPEPASIELAAAALLGLLGLAAVRGRRVFANRLGAGLLSLCACLGLPVGEGHVAKAQSQLTTRVDIYDSSTDVWSTAELSQARVITAATSAGGKAIFAGGGGSFPFVSDRVDMFDVSTGQWSIASLSQPRNAIAATSVGDLALFGGGFSGQGQGVSTVDIYDAAKDQWTQSSFSVPRVSGAATTVGARALFAGGSVDMSYTTTDVVDIYDSAAGQWTTAHLSQARALLAATTAGGKAFFAGGYSQEKGISDVVDIYDSTTDQWSVAHLSEPRALVVAATVGSKAVFAGGDNHSGTGSAVVDIFDTDTGQWSVASLSQSRYTMAAAATGNKAYFAGGGSKDDGSTSYDIVDVYDGNTGLWSVDHLSQDHHYLGGTAVGDLVLFGGGYTLGVPEPASIELAAGALLGVLGLVALRRWRRQPSVLLAALVAASLVSAPTAWADIFRWDNGQVIPGTEGIAPGPAMQLDQWNTEAHNLRYADFAGGLDLHQASFRKSWLDNAHFNNANLSNSDFGPPLSGPFGEAGATLTGADLSGANLTGANLGMADLTSASLRGANLTGSYFGRTSTYPGVVGATLTGADLSGANLTSADLSFSTLNGANLSETLVSGANFDNSVSRGFTQAQLASTASYQAKALQGVNLSGNDMGGWDFSGQNLSGARFFRMGNPRNPWEGFSGLGGANLNEANLTGADLTFVGLSGAKLNGAVVTGANLSATGITQSQLASTADYQGKDLNGINLSGNDMRGWNLSGQNLSGARLGGYVDPFLYGFDANLTNADLSNASVTGADFTGSRGLIQAQLASTASYQAKDLQGIRLGSINMTGWDFSGQTLAGASFEKWCCFYLETIPTTLMGANFRGANLANANLTDALVTGANFGAADARGAQGLDLTGAMSHDTILPDGTIAGLDLAVGEQLVVRNSPISVNVQDHLKMTDGGALELRFDSDPWNSLISFAPSIPVNLGGTLELTFAKDADAAAQVGHSLHPFDWTGVSPMSAFSVSSVYDWDTSGLYNTGVVTLLAAGGVIAGDADGNGKVEMEDFDILKTHFGVPGTKSDGDANGDGRIDLNDFGLLKVNFGKSAAAVPEPSSAILALLAALGFTGVHRWCRQTRALLTALACAALMSAPPAQADIFRWDNHELIPGTEGITPGPGVQLVGWYTEGHNLRYADFTGDLDLNQASFQDSWLDNARFTGANLAGGAIGRTSPLFGNGPTSLTNADLSGANLSGATLWESTLTGANLTEAVVAGANFDDTTKRGFTHSQLESTASYQAKDLHGIVLRANDLTGWDFSGQDLTGAGFGRREDRSLFVYLDPSTLTNANLSDAVVTGADFQGSTSSGFTLAQLASTASYKAKDLQGIGLADNNLTGWDFSGQNLTGAVFVWIGTGPSAPFRVGSTLANANLSGATLTGANLHRTTLTDANLNDAVVAGANFPSTSGFTQAQLASTASYKAKDLHGINLGSNDLTGWDFSGQNLTGAQFGYYSEGDPQPPMLTDANFSGANLTGAGLAGSLTGANFSGANLSGARLAGSLTGANFSGSVVTGANFNGNSDFTQLQLSSTQSYQDKNLTGIGLSYNDLTGWDFSGQNLSNANLDSATLTNANMAGAVVTGANLGATTSRGFTHQQLSSTQSYQDKNLTGIGLSRNDFTGWDFSGQNLSNANLDSATLTNANMAGAVVTGANFGATTSRGFAQQQLSSTQSYQDKNLTGIGLSDNDLTGWDLSGQNLSDASLDFATLTNANLAGAVVTGADFGATTSRGFTQQQLSSTQSYQDKNLAGIGLSRNDFTGWDFSGQNLSNASLLGSTLTNANLSFADMRGARFLPDTSGVASLRDSILPEGVVNSLDLNAGERLVVRDDDGVSALQPQWWVTPRSPIPVTVQDHLTMAVGATLELRFEADPWNSFISFAPGIPVQLGGTLELTFAQGTDPAPQVGHTLHVFDWTGVSPSGQFTVSSLYDWDTSRLYTAGVVTLLAAGGVIAGDADGNGKVEMEDFDILKTHFGDLGSKFEGDANGDGRIDLTDFGLLKINFGKSAAAVPEPSSATLAVLALVGCVGVRCWRRQAPALLAALAFASLLMSAPTARADIFRWDNQELIPGTEGITPGPGVQLSGWNTDGHNLRYADFAGGLDLNQANFHECWLDNARFTGADLKGANLEAATLTNAELSGAAVTGANLVATTSRGFTQDQLQSTASYQAKDLQGIVLAGNDLIGWDLSGQNLIGAWFGDNYSFMEGAPKSVLTDANLSGANLTGARLGGLTLTNANLSGASLAGATLGRSSFDAIDVGATLVHANLSTANLSGANLWDAALSGADLSQSEVTGASFDHTTPYGFTQVQLASTASYQAKDLRGIVLAGNDLAGWDFSGQNLTGAVFFTRRNFSHLFDGVASLTNANLSGANLTGASLVWSSLANANLSGAVVTGADFTASSGLTQSQLASTASYQVQDLRGIGLGSLNMTGWDFSEQNFTGARFVHLGGDPGGPETLLTNANFSGANLTNAAFSGVVVNGAIFDAADTRGAEGLDLTGAVSDNAILPDGKIAGLDLAAGERLVVRNAPISVNVQDHLEMADGGALELCFAADPWSSLISFQTGVPVDLGGKLELTFAQGADPASQVGHTLHVFDWSGVSPTGAFTVLSPYDWDTSGLYTTGVVTLLAAGGAIAGDADGNGKVEMEDFDILKTHFGDTGSKSDGDANGDGRIDLNDFRLLKVNFGKSTPDATPVPEPSAGMLFVVGLALWAAAGLRRGQP